MCSIKINDLKVTKDNIQVMVTYSILNQKKAFNSKDILSSVNNLLKGKIIPDEIRRNKFLISDMIDETIMSFLDADILLKSNDTYIIKKNIAKAS